MKGNKNMEKQKRITLNADKRKVIANVFQDHFESNSKYHKAWQNAKDKYTVMRNQAKTIMEKLIRKHQPQEDVDTLRGMISKYGQSGGDLYHDNCFYVQNSTPKIEENYRGEKEEVVRTHEQMFSHVNKKMEKLKLGLKSYRYFDQAKELADKLGVVLNESILDAHSSMALSIYSPSNLADLLTDEVEQTRDEKIAIAKQLLQEQQNSLN